MSQSPRIVVAATYGAVLNTYLLRGPSKASGQRLPAHHADMVVIIFGKPSIAPRATSDTLEQPTQHEPTPAYRAEAILIHLRQYQREVNQPVIAAIAARLHSPSGLLRILHSGDAFGPLWHPSDGALLRVSALSRACRYRAAPMHGVARRLAARGTVPLHYSTCPPPALKPARNTAHKFPSFDLPAQLRVFAYSSVCLCSVQATITGSSGRNARAFCPFTSLLLCDSGSGLCLRQCNWLSPEGRRA